ncbi:MAG: anaerobic sulfatase maturase [Oscillospiraceae bacterium]|nr:anaerobic sulfatase maturase [Oscillospiraceae bacterium]
MPAISVLIKPASSLCNLRCKYCFYHAIAESRETACYGLMSEEVLEQVIVKVLDFADGLATFSFQGGEPTMCGLNFFRKVVELQKKYNRKNVRINNCLQTNGTLLDEEWVKFLADNRFLVGLSLDGPDYIHNEYRVDAEGKGTHERVMETVRLFDKYKVEYNILFVVNSANSKKPERLYNYFKENGFNFLQFIPCIDPEGYARESFDFSLTNARFVTFLKGFFDKWYNDISKNVEVSVRYFDNLVRIAMGMGPETCSMLGSCRCQFVFEADGSVYPCDFYVTDEWQMGNIADMSIQEMFESVNSQRFIHSSMRVEKECGECKWYRLCRGGCRRDRQDNLTGELGVNTYCSAYKEFFEYAYERIVKLANKFRPVR